MTLMQHAATFLTNTRIAYSRHGASRVLAGIWLIGLFSGCGDSTSQERTSDEPVAPKTVAAVRVAKRVWPTTVSVQGSLVADETAIVGAKAAGRVAAIDVDIGSVVKRGATLARLETELFDLEVQQAQARREQVRAGLGLRPEDPDEKLDRDESPPVREARALLDEAKLGAERAKGLIARRAIAPEELQQYQAALRVAEARYTTAVNSVEMQITLMSLRKTELAIAKQHLADATVTAPFDGVVASRDTSPGDYLDVGATVVTLVRVDPLRFRAGVPERQANRVRKGQPVTIHLESSAEPLHAKVTRISPSLDPANRSLLIEADVPNPDGRLRTGLFAEGQILVGPEDQTLAAPIDAVAEFAGVEKVWQIVDNQAIEKRVRTGRRADGFVEILDGLSPGDQIVADARHGRSGPVAVVEEVTSD